MNNKGYTLMEVLVTVLLIGILSAIAFPQYTKIVERQKGTEILQVLAALGQSQERYFAVNETYSKDFKFLDADITDRKTGRLATSAILNSKNFTIYLSQDNSEAGAKITAIRNGTHSYKIERIISTGKICCGDDNTADSDICDTLDIDERCRN